MDGEERSRGRCVCVCVIISVSVGWVTSMRHPVNCVLNPCSGGSLTRLLLLLLHYSHFFMIANRTIIKTPNSIKYTPPTEKNDQEIFTFVTDSLESRCRGIFTVRPLPPPLSTHTNHPTKKKKSAQYKLGRFNARHRGVLTKPQKNRNNQREQNEW